VSDQKRLVVQDLLAACSLRLVRYIVELSGAIPVSINRGIVETTMTPTQIEKAQDLARECIRKEYKGR